MTDRVSGFTVTLERDFRDDDVVVIADAIRQLRGVAAVTNTVSEPGTYNIRLQERLQMEKAVLRVLRETSLISWEETS